MRIGFLRNDQETKECLCPLHPLLCGGWLKKQSFPQYTMNFMRECNHGPFSPQELLDHLCQMQDGCIFHQIGYHFIKLLYCNSDGNLRPVKDPTEMPKDVEMEFLSGEFYANLMVNPPSSGNLPTRFQ